MVSEWSGLSGRAALIALDIVVGVLGVAALVLVRRAPVRLALVLSVLLSVWVADPRGRHGDALGSVSVAGSRSRSAWPPPVSPATWLASSGAPEADVVELAQRGEILGSGSLVALLYLLAERQRSSD